ncbi:MAG: hypothetical protein J6B85_06870 [Lachnospiraceae bacterium]|nr:hypothetical protein [Lachnospiraceae bacterium]
MRIKDEKGKGSGGRYPCISSAVCYNREKQKGAVIVAFIQAEFMTKKETHERVGSGKEGL